MKQNPVCFPGSNRLLLPRASWSLAACCCSSVESGCSAPSCGSTDPPTNSHKGTRPQRTCRGQIPRAGTRVRPAGERPAHPYRRTGGSTATLRDGWSSPESCAKPGTVASCRRRRIPPRPPSEVCPGVSTLQISPPTRWCRWTTRRWEPEGN